MDLHVTGIDHEPLKIRIGNELFQQGDGYSSSLRKQSVDPAKLAGMPRSVENFISSALTSATSGRSALVRQVRVWIDKQVPS